MADDLSPMPPSSISLYIKFNVPSIEETIGAAPDPSIAAAPTQPPAPPPDPATSVAPDPATAAPTSCFQPARREPAPAAPHTTSSRARPGMGITLVQLFLPSWSELSCHVPSRTIFCRHQCTPPQWFFWGSFI